MKPRDVDLYPCCPMCCCVGSRERQFNRSIDITTGQCSACQGRGLAALPLSELFNTQAFRHVFNFTHPRGPRLPEQKPLK